MAEQELNPSQIGARFEQMDCKGVSKRMRSDRFSNAGHRARFLTRVFDGTSCNWAVRVDSGEEPLFWTLNLPVAAQDIQELR